MILLRRIGRLFTATAAGTVPEAAVLVDGERIEWVGPEARLPARALDLVSEEIDCEGRLVTPGLVDAHTHPVYSGDRMEEIALRSAGASYAEVGAAGGGIVATVAATRATPPAELAARVEQLLARWPAGGATTVEAKTGYHLDRDGETAAVALLAELAGRPNPLPRIEVTYLGAHAVPGEYGGDTQAYSEAVAGWVGAARAAGARHCDVFCDEGYFSVEQSRLILTAGRAAGLLARLHADELARTGGSLLAAELHASSADHLLQMAEEDAEAMAAAGVVATLAPTTALSMGHPPPAKMMLAKGVTLALGSDHNPGTCGTTDMSLVVGLAVTVLGLSVEQALTAATAGGAASLRLDDRGSLRQGMLADLVVWEAEHEGAFAWSFGLEPNEVLIGGATVSR